MNQISTPFGSQPFKATESGLYLDIQQFSCQLCTEWFDSTKKGWLHYPFTSLSTGWIRYGSRWLSRSLSRLGVSLRANRYCSV